MRVSSHITKKQKTGLILFGVFCALVFLEIGFRFSGWVITSYYGYKASKPSMKPAEIRVLCLGESTTARAYPPVLQKWLDEHDFPGKFQVIDRGVYATNSAVIASKIEEYLDEINPHIVISMIGANDTKDIICYEETVLNKWTLMLTQMRLYKLAKLLWSHTSEKIKNLDQSQAIEKFDDPGGKKIAVSLKIETLIQKADQHFMFEQYLKSQELYKEILRQDPKHIHALYGLAKVYTAVRDYDKAIRIFQALLEEHPNSIDYYFDLAYGYRGQQREDLAENIYRALLKKVPRNGAVYYSYGVLLVTNQRYQEGASIFEKGLKADPSCFGIYNELGACYRLMNQYDDAIRVYRGALKKQPENGQILGALAICYQKAGDHYNASMCFKKAKQIHKKDYLLQTEHNYLKIRNAVLRRGSILFSMQYPFRPVESLRRMLGHHERLIYVSQGESFQRALHLGSYEDLFTDSFGGDFGHTTAIGNNLIAKKVGEAILEYLSSQAPPRLSIF